MRNKVLAGVFIAANVFLGWQLGRLIYDWGVINGLSAIDRPSAVIIDHPSVVKKDNVCVQESEIGEGA